MNPDVQRLVVAALGAVLGYAFGRWLWIHRRLALSMWPIAAGLLVVLVLTAVLFGMVGLSSIWATVLFPAIVGFGAGLVTTPARPPRSLVWWAIWQ